MEFNVLEGCTLQQTLEFADQKNGVKGERLGHAATDDPFLCPCKALGRLCLHLQEHNASPDTPLHHHFNASDNNWYEVTSTFITNALRHAAKYVQEDTGILPHLISARSLRPGGATALLCANVDPNTIQLLGRWRSDAMLRYLRVQAHAFRSNFAQQMLSAGNFTFAPGADSSEELPVPQNLPAAVDRHLGLSKPPALPAALPL